MKRLPLIAAAVLAAGSLAGVAGADGSSGGPALIEAKGPAFPVRTYVLSLPSSHQLTPNDVNVTENRGPVAEMSLVPASQASEKTFGTVLVLDTSWSMNGSPLESAVKAEQAFAAQSNGTEQIGAIDFNRTPKVVLKLTSSKAKITSALNATRPVATGTHIYDAVAQAEAMLTAAHIGSGSIIVLSDGADTGSSKTLDQVANAAKQAHMRIYTVGLDDKSFNPGTLKALAKKGNGQYAQAKTKELKPLFEQLGQQLSNEYLLKYKSLAGPDKPVVVTVQVNGVGTARSGYRTPALSVPKAPPPPGTYHESIGNRIERSPITMVALALLAASVVALLIIVLLQPKRSNLPARMAEFVSIRGLQRDKGQPAPEKEASEERTRSRQLAETLEIADISLEPETLVAGTFVLTALTFLLIYLGTGSPWWALLALVIPYLSREWVLRTLARRRSRFAEQLPDALQVVGSALRSGHSFAGALAVVVESASDPMKSEMQRVVADEQRGVPIQESLGVVAQRMASRDVEQLALVAQLQREAGGDAAEVVDRVAETVRERFDLRRLIQTLTMQGRMSRWIISVLPIIVIVAVTLEDPRYFHPLTSTTGGKIVLGLAAAWAIAGLYAIKKIVEIEV